MPTCERASRLMPRIPRHSQQFRELYAGRGAIEREFGYLKHRFGLAPIRVRGLERVALHADLVMLARLGQALIRARAVPLAASGAADCRRTMVGGGAGEAVEGRSNGMGRGDSTAASDKARRGHTRDGCS